MAKTISMQVAIKNIIGYVSNMSLLLSDEEATALKKEQSGKAVALINNCKIDPTTAHGDGEEALTLLTDPGCPWSKEEKAPIVSAIRTKVEGIRQEVKRPAGHQQRRGVVSGMDLGFGEVPL